MKLKTIAAAFAAAMMFAAPALAADRLFDDIFTSHMVLQREHPITLSGKAEPGTRLDVAFAGDGRKVTADKAGRWSATFPSRPANAEPVTVTVKAEGRSETLSDLLIGDVWLCSGQSNMNWPVERALNPERYIEAEQRPDLRLFTVALASHIVPQDGLPGASGWQVASAETVRSFSAVCYFTARDLQAAHDVPVGLVHSSWGGSQIEAWISAAGLKDVEGQAEGLTLLKDYAKDPVAATEAYGKGWERRWTAQVPAGTPGPWVKDGAGDWVPVPAAFGDWNLYGDPALKGFTGAVWYAADVTLTADQAKGAARLSLGGIDETDIAWVNGVAVGNSFGWGTPRTYRVKAGLLREGRNRIVVNVYNSWAAGGLTGPAEAIALTLPDGAQVPVTGWRYRIERQIADMPAPAPWYSINGLTGLHNAMIAPLGPLPLKGVLWYQGESNITKAASYERLLHAMIADWRGQFGADLPFIVIQLPAFGNLNATPMENGWAGVRDAERRVAQADPAVGLAVTIDAGDRFELHPPSKQEVARRTALIARRLAYGDDTDIRLDGRSPLSARRDGDGITVEFGTEGGALTAMSAGAPFGFEVCGEAKNSCAFAPAKRDGTRVLIDVPAGLVVRRVRYAWGGAPVANLYEANGMPVSPFEIAVTP
ncbi:sialate O-acetylesterase [Gimibacter soli]|uniref:Sialate O-acetylesterase n=1 Tax=Gimibacter soli TaxID=3024400 RepID=A0AAF0BLC1_9PROT|nr:sialate O-acetylesterase [Gimibacter soli]WCL55289.1 sialate O-acetylesterase [Gimibacter soli]